MAPMLLHAANNDPRWVNDDPHAFRPERMMTAEGQKSGWQMPFGHGPRCVSLRIVNLFVFWGMHDGSRILPHVVQSRAVCPMMPLAATSSVPCLSSSRNLNASRLPPAHRTCLHHPTTQVLRWLRCGHG